MHLFCTGTTPGRKTDASKADKRGGGLGGRKALNDISNSRKPSAFSSVKKDNSINVISIDKDPSASKGMSSKKSERGKVGGRKALTDLTNSVKPRPKQVPSLGRKLNSVAEVAEEGFLHNHQECIKAQMMTVDRDYFLKSVGLSNGNKTKSNLEQRCFPFFESNIYLLLLDKQIRLDCHQLGRRFHCHQRR